MSSNLIRTKDGQNYSKLNVFQRLTMKKGLKTDNTTFKSHINLKQKTPIPTISQTPRSYLTSSKFYDKKHEKDTEKVFFTNSKYKNIVFPVQYAEHGLVIELQSELNGNRCKIQMDYNQYNVLINGLDHHFMMPIMQISIKMIKVILSQQWFPDCSISIYRTKYKIKQYQIQTNAFLNLNLNKIVQIDPFKQFQQSQLKRKEMLLNNIPKLRIDKIVCKTQADESSIQQPQSEQLSNYSDLKNNKSNKSLNKSEFYLSPSSRRNLIKKDIFKLMTPRSRIMQQQKQDQKTQKKITHRHFDLGFGSPKYNKKSTTSQNIQSFLKFQPQQGNSKILSSVTKTKSNIYCSPKRM